MEKMGRLMGYSHFINALGEFLESQAQSLLAEPTQSPTTNSVAIGAVELLVADPLCKPCPPQPRHPD